MEVWKRGGLDLGQTVLRFGFGRFGSFKGVRNVAILTMHKSSSGITMFEF